MNFRKIQWIFVIAFIFLDLFLLTTYLRQSDAIALMTDKSDANTTTAILRNIKSDRIQYGHVSDEHSKGYYVAAPVDNSLRHETDKLHNQTTSFEDNILQATFTTPIKVGQTQQAARKKLANLLADSSMILHGDKYSYNAHLSSKDVMVYTQKFYDRPVLFKGGQIRFNIHDGYVDSYSQGYIAKYNTLREEQVTLSQERALIWLYQYKKITSDSTVLWSQLGYSRLLKANGNRIYIPTWTFAVKNNVSGVVQYRRVNAFTGAIFNGDDNNITVDDTEN